MAEDSDARDLLDQEQRQSARRIREVLEENARLEEQNTQLHDEVGARGDLCAEKAKRIAELEAKLATAVGGSAWFETIKAEVSAEVRREGARDERNWLLGEIRRWEREGGDWLVNTLKEAIRKRGDEVDGGPD